MNRMDEQKRRYTFGNDEFSLEAAYHDCKLVFDGITDDDSFQKADTGLILYYANEIIYALHEALEGKDTNVGGNLIYRQVALEHVVHMDLFGKDYPVVPVAVLKKLQPAQQWIPCSKEMPKKKGRYIVTVRNIFDNIEVRFRYWNADCKLWSGDQMDEVLAWCEIPEPWEDEKAEGAATP